MRLDEVWVRYRRGGPWVLQDVNLQLNPGEIVVVLGRNGAGKSTLLQTMAGVLRPDRGRITDRPTRMGWVPERFAAEQPFTTAAYLTAMAAVRGLPAGPAARAVDTWIERLGLTAFRDVRLAALSKGTAQKVGLAQALLDPPQLLILDEPWEGLDAATRELVPQIVLELIAGGGAVLISDHQGETARLPGTTLWTVADGRVDTTAAESDQLCVVEVGVSAAEMPATVARLQADGHRILRVREEALP